MNVSEITLRRLNLPLKIPYKLAFGPVTAFDTILVTVTGDNGEEGFGEATILTGYTPETVDGAWAKARPEQPAGSTLVKTQCHQNSARALLSGLTRHAQRIRA